MEINRKSAYKLGRLWGWALSRELLYGNTKLTKLPRYDSNKEFSNIQSIVLKRSVGRLYIFRNRDFIAVNLLRWVNRKRYWLHRCGYITACEKLIPATPCDRVSVACSSVPRLWPGLDFGKSVINHLFRTILFVPSSTYLSNISEKRQRNTVILRFLLEFEEKVIEINRKYT